MAQRATAERPALRIGVQAGGAKTGAEWLDRCRALEAMGYDVIQVADHVVGGALSPMLALAAAAAVTSRVRLGTLVLANDFRNPLVVARETLTLDVLSNGRAELGLGAGWLVRDYESLGIPFDRARVRVARLAESVALIKRLFADEKVTFEGRHYRTLDAEARPKPVQSPGPPIMVAGGGPRILALAAREADIVAPIPSSDAGGNVKRDEFSRAWLEQKLEIVRREAAGRDVEINLLLFTTVVTDDRAKTVREIAERFGQPEALISDSPFLALGTLGEIGAQLRRDVRAYGIGYLTVRGDHVDTFAPLAMSLRHAHS